MIFVGTHLDEGAFLDADAHARHLRGALALGFVHQFVGAGEQVVRELARDVAAGADGPEPQADDADVDLDRLFNQPCILAAPVEAFDRLAEPLGDDPRVVRIVELGNQEAEFVAAKAGVQLLRDAEVRRNSPREKNADFTMR